MPQAIRLARPVPDETADEPEAQQPEEHDPIGLLAEAAGYSDHELWWEHQVERRQDAAGMFDAIREAMQSLRAEATPPPEDEALREAHMRTAIRAALKQGRERVAVVCGAWHAPALAEPGPAQPDAELLRGLPKVKTEATWIPWTHSRLSYRSGYGAGRAVVQPLRYPPRTSFRRSLPRGKEGVGGSCRRRCYPWRFGRPFGQCQPRLRGH